MNTDHYFFFFRILSILIQGKKVLKKLSGIYLKEPNS